MSKPLSEKLSRLLSTFDYNKVQSASWYDRHEYEALVKRELVIKHHNGRLVTYTRA